MSVERCTGTLSTVVTPFLAATHPDETALLVEGSNDEQPSPTAPSVGVANVDQPKQRGKANALTVDTCDDKSNEHKYGKPNNERRCAVVRIKRLEQ